MTKTNYRPNYNLFLDDFRQPTENKEWIIARDYKSFCAIIESHGLPEFISFDHDLADAHYKHLDGEIPYETLEEKTGYHCAKWLIEYCQNNKQQLPRWTVHSLNPVGGKNIHEILSSFERIQIQEPEHG